MGHEISDNMNPINYWYADDKQAQAFLKSTLMTILMQSVSATN